jgi:acetate kinase
MTHVLVVNSGSSTLKYQLIDPETGDAAARGLVDRIGQPAAEGGEVADHAAAVELMLDQLRAGGVDLADLVAVGHRVVHGGAEFREPVVVDDEVEAAIERMVPLAPLHNPAGLLGIRIMRRLLPEVPQVAVFDTAFHATMPPEAYTYAIPVALAEANGIRRYGFHGTSYQYVTRRAAKFLGIPENEVNLIVAHLGNGASITAIRGGRSVDTSMGMTPLEGLVMGTRSGDIDPGIIFHLVNAAGMSVDQVDRTLNKESGMAGLAGEQDLRTVHDLADGGDPAARLALDVYAYRIRFYIGAYLAVVPNVNALVFTAGIGENDAALRAAVCRPLAHMGLHLDEAANASESREARAVDDGSGFPRILVIPTNEEAEIARQAAQTVAVQLPGIQ